jgi:hypothetical protein
VTRRVGLNSFRCYMLFKMLASRVWPVGLAQIHLFHLLFCSLHRVVFEHTFQLPQVSNSKSRLRVGKFNTLVIISWALFWTR